MPYIVQWKVLNKLHKDSHLQLLSTTNFALGPLASNAESSPTYQTLPVLKESEEVGIEHNG
jgi:hypothetical protein